MRRRHGSPRGFRAAPRLSDRHLLVVPLRISLRLWELMVISAVLQLGMLPPLAYYFHRVTLAGPLANIPAVLLTGLIVPLGFFTLAASLVSHALAQLLRKASGISSRDARRIRAMVRPMARSELSHPGTAICSLIVVFVAATIVLSAAIRSALTVAGNGAERLCCWRRRP